MNTFRKLGLLGATAILCFGAACSKGPETGGPAETPSSDSGGGVYKPTGDEGTITGKISFTGTAPAPKKIDMSNDAYCAGKHPGGGTADDVMVADGKLDDVFVYIQSDGFKNVTFEAPKTEVTLDQTGCMYSPHVMGIMTKQPFKVVTSDNTNHNINVLAQKNEAFNVTQPPGASPISKNFPREETMINVKCNQHSWMKSYVGVLKHPFFAVSKNGTFTLNGVPPGSYTLVAWHEKFGTKQMPITVGKKDSKAVDFTFDASSASNVVSAPAGLTLTELSITMPHQH